MSFPTTGILDNFNRPDEDPATGWTKDPNSAFVPVRVVSNTLRIQSGHGTSFSWNYNDAGNGSGPDAEAYVTVAGGTLTDALRVGLRIGNGTQPRDGYYLSVASGNTWSFLRITAGGTNTLSAL